MRTFGELKFGCVPAATESQRDKWLWVISAEPHVMIKLKSVFPRINKGDLGRVHIAHSAEVCRDLEWFIQRYPLRFADELTEKSLREGSLQFQKTLLDLEAIHMPGYTPRDFKMAVPPRHYQSQGCELYLKSGRLLNCDQIGLGKTASAICSFADKSTLPALVVCQTQIAWQWESELKKFMPSLRSHIIKKSKPYDLPSADVYIITYSKLAGWGDVLNILIRSVVFDEVQELRHSGTAKYDTAKSLADSCDYSLGLSATPIYNYGGEAWNIFNIINPDKLGTRDEFKREWCAGFEPKIIIRDPKAFGSYLREQHMMIRRTREEVGLELPAVQRIVQTIPYDAKVMNDIEDNMAELARTILNSQDFHEKGEAARTFDLRLRQATGISKAPFVADFVRMFVEDDERKVVLFGWHRAVYDIWMERLKDFFPALYTGSETPKEKEAAKQRFINDPNCKVFIMSLGSAVGVDGLQKVCCTNVFGELAWNPGVHDQAEGRTNRDGVIGPVSSFFLCSDAGSDPPMCELLGLKSAQLQGIILEKGEKQTFQQSDVNRVKQMAQIYLNKRK